jgi:hypothetical protein
VFSVCHAVFSVISGPIYLSQCGLPTSPRPTATLRATRRSAASSQSTTVTMTARLSPSLSLFHSPSPSLLLLVLVLVLTGAGSPVLRSLQMGSLAVMAHALTARHIEWSQWMTSPTDGHMVGSSHCEGRRR